jgi:mono/diheme cytochrome c family protein
MPKELIQSLVITALCAALAGPNGAFGASNIPTDSERIARGKYLTTAGDCISCHTAPQGKPFAGGLYMNTPFGPISTPNITPDRQTGIGSYSDADFYRVLHNGIGKQGEYLYPVMPFPWYTKVSRDDVLAIKAYLFSLEPVQNPRPPNKMRFPFNVREGLAAWRALFFRAAAEAPNAGGSAAIGRGGYLVEGLGHCGECHNGDKLVGDSRWGHSLQGGEIDGWYAPNLTSNVGEGIGDWTTPELVQYLQTGVSAKHGLALGPMAEAVHESLSRLDQSDLQAMAEYLKATPASGGFSQAKLADYAGRGAPGATEYLSFCSSCHGVNGAGLPRIAPALIHNGAVSAQGPQNVIRVILGGKEATESYAPMIAIGLSMSDEQVADVANYVRQSWSNAAPATAAPGLVAELRAETQTLLNATSVQQCQADTKSAAQRWIEDPAHGIEPLLSGLTEDNLLERAQKITAKVKLAKPALKKAQAVNALTAAYCPIVQSDTSLSPSQRGQRLGNFSEVVYTELTEHHAL